VKKDLDLAQHHAGEGRRIAECERLVESQLVDIEIDGRGNVLDGQAGMELLAFDERPRCARHNSLLVARLHLGLCRSAFKFSTAEEMDRFMKAFKEIFPQKSKTTAAGWLARRAVERSPPFSCFAASFAARWCVCRTEQRVSDTIP
jgi:hypothetical protein